MKYRLLPALALIVLAGCASSPSVLEAWYPPVNVRGDPVFAVFESRVPCADCEKIKFALALYRDRDTKAPTTYKLARVYVGKADDRIVNEGTWTVAHGAKFDPQALVYRLDAAAPPEFRAFWAIGHDILFILDQDHGPRVGNAGYGYALNRTR